MFSQMASLSVARQPGSVEARGHGLVAPGKALAEDMRSRKPFSKGSRMVEGKSSHLKMFPLPSVDRVHRTKENLEDPSPLAAKPTATLPMSHRSEEGFGQADPAYKEPPSSLSLDLDQLTSKSLKERLLSRKTAPERATSQGCFPSFSNVETFEMHRKSGTACITREDQDVFCREYFMI